MLALSNQYRVFMVSILFGCSAGLHLKGSKEDPFPAQRYSDRTQYELVGKLSGSGEGVREGRLMYGIGENTVTLNLDGTAEFIVANYQGIGSWDKRQPTDPGATGRIVNLTGHWAKVKPGQYSVIMTQSTITKWGAPAGDLPNVTKLVLPEHYPVSVVGVGGSKYSWHMDVELKAGPTGLTMGRSDGHRPEVVSVEPGSQGDLAGVKKGWRVVHVAEPFRAGRLFYSDGSISGWGPSCNYQNPWPAADKENKPCFKGHVLQPWSAEANTLVRFSVPKKQGYEEVRVNWHGLSPRRQLKAVDSPDAPAFYSQEDD